MGGGGGFNLGEGITGNFSHMWCSCWGSRNCPFVFRMAEGPSVFSFQTLQYDEVTGCSQLYNDTVSVALFLLHYGSFCAPEDGRQRGCSNLAEELPTSLLEFLFNVCISFPPNHLIALLPWSRWK